VRKCETVSSGSDERMLVSWAEMNDMAEGVFSLVELEDLYKRRRADEQQKEL
jgi:hypothetical protein